MRVLVVGGGAAGMSCASLVKRRAPETDVTVLERGGYVSYSACGIPHWLAGTVEGGPDELVVLDAEQAREERGIDVRKRTRVVDVDPKAHSVLLEAEEGSRRREDYDRLVLATGAEPVDPFTEGQLANVFTFRHLDDGIEARRWLEDEDPQRACVVGGGFVGIEVAEALKEQGVDVVLVEDEDSLMGGRLAPELAERLDGGIRAHGVDLRTGTPAVGIETERGRAEAVRLEGERVPADGVVLALGVQPRTQLAESLGCRLDDSGGVLVDETMHTTVQDVYACGDCVAYPHRLKDERVVQPLALHANRSGRIAGETILDEATGFPGVLGTAMTRFGDLEVALTGLDAADAEDWPVATVSATIEAKTRAGYYPGAEPIQVHLVAEEPTGRLLGGQIVGGPGAGKRIDTIAAAIWQQATCRDVEAMDLAYAPPASPTWDPVAIAARMTAREADASASRAAGAR